MDAIPHLSGNSLGECQVHCIYVKVCTHVQLYVTYFYRSDVAELVFNRCSKNNATKDGKITPESKNFKVDFNYEFLEDYRDVQVPSIFNWLVKIVQHSLVPTLHPAFRKDRGAWGRG